MNPEPWQDYLFITETKLNELTTDQIATCAKMLALEVGRYRVRFGESGLEEFENYRSTDQLDDKRKEIFESGMEALLSVIQQVEITKVNQEIKKH